MSGSLLAHRLSADLRTFPVQAPWERVVVSTGLAVLARSGVGGLSNVVEALGSTESLRGSSELTTRELSDLLAMLENAEADRLERSRSILKALLDFAKKMAEELLKAALGGLL
jgi:hypothetical protein